MMQWEVRSSKWMSKLDMFAYTAEMFVESKGAVVDTTRQGSQGITDEDVEDTRKVRSDQAQTESSVDLTQRVAG